MNKLIKKEMKNFIVEKVSASKYDTDNLKKRIEYVCRANINRLSYELKFENNSIILQYNDKIRIIEFGKGKSDYSFRHYVYEQATCYLKEVKEKFPKPVKEIA